MRIVSREMPTSWAAAWLAFSVLCTPSIAIYLPGVAPREYAHGAKVEMKVNTLTSVKTQLPYRYYTLPYCQPDTNQDRAENLGEILAGDDIENSPYELLMRENESCKVLCQKPLEEKDKEMFRRRIDRAYFVNWIVDNLPAATKYERQQGDATEFIYMNGFPVGLLQNGKYFLHNHVRITISYHSSDEYEGYRVVGFEVQPRSMVQSVKGEGGGSLTAECDSVPGELFDLETHDEITYTYDVIWKYSDVRWASRWDNYLKMAGGQIHWFSILNSVMIVLFLSGLVATILLRTLHRDIVNYNELATSEEMAEETGWKLVHGDVFRKPPHSKLLVTCVGSGVQLLGMAVVTIVFAALGILSPAHRGGLLQSTLLLFTFMSVLAGYSSARLYKLFQGEDWKESTIMTAFLIPGFVFSIFFLLNLLIWGQKSAGAVPFATLFALLVLWFGISVPLVFLGSYMGYRKPVIEIPVRISQMPRKIPQQPWYMKPVFTCMMGGILPFGAVFTELFFIMSSIWQHQIYYMFGFLVLVLIILVITCAEISIALTYFQLTAEDYHWWWRSFFSSGSSGVYVLLYACLYFRTQLQIDKLVSTLLYFGYMFIISGIFTLLTGSIGLIATFYFVRAIYGSIKVD